MSSQTLDEVSGNGNHPATGAATSEDGPQLARAREGIIADLVAALPNTESFQRLWISLQDFAGHVWNGEIWDIQPPSPRELCDRVLQSPWNTSDEKLLHLLAKTGMVLTVVWSVPFYTLAVLGQRFWRAFWAIALVVLIWNLI